MDREPGRLQSMGSQRVKTQLSNYTHLGLIGGCCSIDVSHLRPYYEMTLSQCKICETHDLIK